MPARERVGCMVRGSFGGTNNRNLSELGGGPSSRPVHLASLSRGPGAFCLILGEQLVECFLCDWVGQNRS